MKARAGTSGKGEEGGSSSSSVADNPGLVFQLGRHSPEGCPLWKQVTGGVSTGRSCLCCENSGRAGVSGGIPVVTRVQDKAENAVDLDTEIVVAADGSPRIQRDGET